MKATQVKLLSFLKESPHIVNPIYRRTFGRVEVGLTSLDELPYVIGLVRQSYQRQMGDGGQI